MSTQQHGLAALVARLERVTVKILGQEFPARLISGDQQRLLLHVMPPPSPPLVADPTKGSLAPKIPDFKAPEYIRDYTLWDYRQRCALVGLAIHRADPRALGCEPLDTIGRDEAKFLAAANLAADLLAQVSFDDVTDAHRAITTGPAGITEEAEKNS